MPNQRNEKKICCNSNCIYKGEKQYVSNFYANNSMSDGLDPWCRDCRREDRKKNIEKRRDYNKIYRTQHAKDRRIHDNEYYYKTKDTDISTKQWDERKSAENNGNWRGNDVGYGGLHLWINRHKPESKVCEHCERNLPLEAANISGEYKRDINDYVWLCHFCHRQFDFGCDNQEVTSFQVYEIIKAVGTPLSTKELRKILETKDGILVTPSQSQQAIYYLYKRGLIKNVSYGVWMIND